MQVGMTPTQVLRIDAWYLAARLPLVAAYYLEEARKELADRAAGVGSTA